MRLFFKKMHSAAILPGGKDNDIYSPVECVIRPNGDYEVIGTGLIPLIPPGFELHISPRFSLAVSSQVAALPGIIHSRENEEIKIMLVNHSVVPFKVHVGTAIAQITLVPVVPISHAFEETLVNTLEEVQHV